MLDFKRVRPNNHWVNCYPELLEERMDFLSHSLFYSKQWSS